MKDKNNSEFNSGKTTEEQGETKLVQSLMAHFAGDIHGYDMFLGKGTFSGVSNL